MLTSSKRQELLRWCIYFLSGNALVVFGLSIIAICAFFLDGTISAPLTSKILLSLLILIHQAGFTILGVSLIGVILALCIFILPNRRIVMGIAIPLTTIFCFELIGDTLSYNLTKQHINNSLSSFLLHLTQNQVSIQKNLKISISILSIFFVLECILAWLIQRELINKNRHIPVKKWIMQSKLKLKPNNKKRSLIRFCNAFFIANIPLFWLFGLNFLRAQAWDKATFIGHYAYVLHGYFYVSYIGQLALFALLPCFAITFIALIFPSRRLIFSTSVIAATIIACLVATDSFVYYLFRYHVNGIIFNLFLSSFHDALFGFSTHEMILCTLGLFFIIGVECLLGVLIWRRVFHANKHLPGSRLLIIIAALCIYSSYSLTMMAADKFKARFYLETARTLPLYTEFLGYLLPIDNGKIALERAFETRMMQPDQATSPLIYPLQTLRFEHVNKHLNIVVILIDTWRYDMVDPAVTPNIYAFAHQSWRFKQHFSGGNATGPGIFSLFYGLTATYWTSMYTQHHGPVLLDALMKQHYNLFIPESNMFTLPAFHQTVFQSVPHFNIKPPIKPDEEHDLAVTQAYLKYITQSHSPYFSVLYYTSAHSYCSIKNNFSPFKPTAACDRTRIDVSGDLTPYINRYKNALHTIDAQVGTIIKNLEKSGQLDNTIVILTGDHGEEFNDNHLGYWGHTSNFTHYQLQTPLIIHWPHSKPKTITYKTTHYDVAPTLMHDVLGCITPPQQYSMGDSLFKPTTTPYFIAASYIGVGIINKDKITTLFPTGTYQISDLNGRPVADEWPNNITLHAIFKDLKRFYRQT